MLNLTNHPFVDMQLYLNYLEFKASVSPVVASMRAQYIRKKNSYQYSERKQFSEGLIDFDKIMTYKTNSDIFKNIETTRKGKSHGVVIAIDTSISMVNDLAQIVEQALTTSFFCDSCNIPYEIYLCGAMNKPTQTLKTDTLFEEYGDIVVDPSINMRVVNSSESKDVVDNKKQALYHMSRIVSRKAAYVEYLIKSSTASNLKYPESFNATITQHYSKYHILCTSALFHRNAGVGSISPSNSTYSVCPVIGYISPLASNGVSSALSRCLGIDISVSDFGHIGTRLSEFVSGGLVNYTKTTPTPAWILGLIPAVKTFKASKGLQNVCCLLLTDGVANTAPRIKYSKNGSCDSEITNPSYMFSKHVDLIIDGTPMSVRDFDTRTGDLTGGPMVNMYHTHMVCAGIFKKSTRSKLALMVIEEGLQKGLEALIGKYEWSRDLFSPELAACTESKPYISFQRFLGYDLVSLSINRRKTETVLLSHDKKVDSYKNTSIKARQFLIADSNRKQVANRMGLDIVNMLCADFKL